MSRKSSSNSYLTSDVPDIIRDNTSSRPGTSRSAVGTTRQHVYMRRIRSEPLTFIDEVYGRFVDEDVFEKLLIESGLENFLLCDLYNRLEEDVMRGTKDHVVSKEGRVDAEILWQLTLRIAVDLAESCSIFSTITLVLLLAEVRYLLSSRGEVMEENVSMGRKMEQMREHIEHIVEDGRGLEQSMEEETAKKIRLLEKYYCDQLKKQEEEFQESTCSLKQFWLESQKQQEEEISRAHLKLTKSNQAVKSLQKVIDSKEEKLRCLELKLGRFCIKKKKEEEEKETKESDSSEPESKKNPPPLVTQRTLSPVIIGDDEEAPKEQEETPSVNNAEVDRLQAEKDQMREEMTSQIAKLKEENSLLRSEREKENEKLREEYEKKLIDKDAVFRKEKDEATRRFAQEKRDLERGLSVDMERQLAAFQEKKRELEEKMEYEKAELCHTFQMERSDMVSSQKKEIEKMKVMFEAKMMELSAENDKLKEQLDQVEDKFKMLRIETEKKGSGSGGGKRGGAKGEPEIPPAVQVELVDLSKQVMKLRGEKESWARKEEEREVELQRLRHQEQDLKIEKEALEQKLATMEKRVRELDEERGSLSTLKSQLVQEASEARVSQEKERTRMEEEHSIVKRDMELQFKEELCCQKVKLDEMEVMKMELEQKVRELEDQISQLQKHNQHTTLQTQQEMESFKEHCYFQSRSGMACSSTFDVVSGDLDLCVNLNIEMAIVRLHWVSFAAMPSRTLNSLSVVTVGSMSVRNMTSCEQCKSRSLGVRK
ncbi:golgin subfamily A member 6-like protein 22 [Symsagittifera roscoffensis]|uniref:golgin subfamily A member 6-like protein 22 n=1 Tax=Symsagittifera roscoffensis TaxID=84072 RepID=UPI00307C1E2F